MIGLDTNVLVRYVAQDDPVQSAKASTLIESFSTASPGFIAMFSVVELVWVLQSSYKTNKANKANIISVLETLLRTKELKVERAEVIWQALRRFNQANADFADCLIERCAHAADCDYTVTFDSKAAKTAGMHKLT